MANGVEPRQLGGTLRPGDEMSPAATSGEVEKQFGWFEGTIVASFLFTSGWFLCLPVAGDVVLPWWAVKIEVVPRVLLHEALFIAYLGTRGVFRMLNRFTRPSFPTRAAAVWLIGLAAWCGAISISGPLPAQDIGRSLRLIVMALLLLNVTLWALRDARFVLRYYLAGVLAGTVTNIWFTFEYPYMVEGVLRLLGQNTPGPAMGLGVCLAAWFFLASRRPRDLALGMVVAIVCGYGAMISFSKTGIFAGFVGLLSVLIVARGGLQLPVVHRKAKRRLAIAIAVVALAGVVWFQTPGGRDLFIGVQQVVWQKVEFSMAPESRSSEFRMAYVEAVLEIMVKNPPGVGYSGFRDAMIKTAVYRTGESADDSGHHASEANPHMLWLYYASAGGVVGAAASVVVFLLLSQAILRGLRVYGFRGRQLAWLTISVFLMLGLSTPIVFNSGLMIIAAGIAAGIGLKYRVLAFAATRGRRTRPFDGEIERGS